METERDSEGSSGPVKVLVADDEVFVRNTVRDLLVARGVRVRVVANGRQALAAVRAWGPDLAVLDVKMPGLDGREVCRAIKEDPELRGVTVVLCSALSEREVGWHEAGADAFYSKGARMRHLPALLQRLRAEHRWE